MSGEKLAEDIREVADLQRKTAASMEYCINMAIMAAAASTNPRSAMRHLKQAEALRKAAAQALRAAKDLGATAEQWSGECDRNEGHP